MSNCIYFDDGIGFVRLASTNGDEQMISRIAGLSHESKDGPPVEKLLSWNHVSPFEFASATYHIKCPIFVARQLFRHRTGSYLEKSLRYCTTNEVYIPKELETDYTYKETLKNLLKSYNYILGAYKDKFYKDREKELARNLLPLATYTEFYCEFDLRNLINLFRQRIDSHAQAETQWYATQMRDMLKESFPRIF